MKRNRSRSLLFLAVATASAGAATFLGCGDDDNTITAPDAGRDTSTPDVGTPDTGAADAGADAAALVARGKYLVDHVAACPDCHTPRLNTGAPDMTKYLSGAECFADLNGPADGGCVHSRNLTSDSTGLKDLTDTQIKSLLVDGKKPDGGNLFPIMPYWIFHNLAPADVDAIIAYLRTVPAVAHNVPPNDPPFENPAAAATPVDPSTVPSGGPANGRYLAQFACMDCHTPDLPPGSARPIDMTRPFAGGRAFQVGPNSIVSKNLTPDKTGLDGGWSQADIVRVLKEGRDPEDGGICPPMPVGPMGAFGGLTDQDAKDIADYIRSLSAISNPDAAVENLCP